MKRINFYRHIFISFGSRATFFLLISKFKKSPTRNIRIRSIKHPITLSNFREDVTTLFQIFFAKEYEITSDTRIETIIDCGANIGLSAVYFANKYPNAKIIAIEPDSNNFSFLQNNARNYPNVSCLQRAVWPVNTSLEVVDPGRGGWGLQTKRSSNGKLKSITIEEIMEQYHLPKIDLLKIDIEGAEQELFEYNYDNWLSKTSAIAIELHDFLRPGISHSFYKAIEPYAFKIHTRGENLICQK